MLKERTESLLRMARTPTTQVEVPSSEEKAFNEGGGNEVPAAQPKISLFPYKNKKRAIRPKNFSVAPSSDTTEEMAESQLGGELGLQLESGAPPGEPKVLTPLNGDDDVDYDDEELGTSVEGADNEDSIAHNADGTPGDDHRKGSDTSDDCLRVFEDELLDGIVEGQSSQPVITQQIIRDLIINQRQTISQPPHSVSEGWEEKKLGYSRLLEGCESPTGNTFRATLELGSLMFAAVAAEGANQRILMAQQDANEKLVKQAERHREIMEKEFTEGLARVKMENQRTIDETIRIRDELMQMCKPKISEEEDYLRRVDDNQSPEIARIQLEVLRKKAARCEKELRENEERHEMELAQEKASTAA
jgi:hypothetical protein